MAQGDYMELHKKRYGKRLDHDERMRKRAARERKLASKLSKQLKGKKAKMYHKKRVQEKATMRKKIKSHEEKQSDSKAAKKEGPKNPLPIALMDRLDADRQKVMAQSLKQKKKEKGAKWAVPVPRVKPMVEDEMFKVKISGKRRNNAWKRMITKASFVGDAFTRKSPKYERFIRPMAMRFKHCHVTHPELKRTFKLPIIGVRKNPQSKVYTTLGVMTKGTVIEVNVSELGLVTPAGKIAWAKFAQITNNPENDGCINAVLLV